MARIERNKRRPIAFWSLLTLSAGLDRIVTRDAYEALGGAISKGSAFELVFAMMALWLLLATILLIGGRKPHMPRWATGFALAVVPLSGLSAFVAANLIWEPQRWPVVFPVVLPLGIAAFAVWTRVPRFHTLLRPRLVCGVGLPLILLISIVPLVLWTCHFHEVARFGIRVFGAASPSTGRPRRRSERLVPG